MNWHNKAHLEERVMEELEILKTRLFHKVTKEKGKASRNRLYELLGVLDYKRRFEAPLGLDTA